jgi:amidohydrolase
MARIVSECAGGVVGKGHVVEPDPSMGSEDIAFFFEKSKGCYFYLGVGHEGGAPLHSPRFDFREDILLLGVETYCRVASELLK